MIMCGMIGIFYTMYAMVEGDKALPRQLRIEVTSSFEVTIIQHFKSTAFLVLGFICLTLSLCKFCLSNTDKAEKQKATRSG